MTMELQVRHLFELLEARRDKLRRLLTALTEGQGAMVRLNLEAIRERNCEQRSLCHEIRRLDSELALLKREWFARYPEEARQDGLRAIVTKVDPGSKARLEQLLKALDTVQAEVRQANRVQAELLRRSRRSIQMLSNLLANFMGTYQPPNPIGYPGRRVGPGGLAEGRL